MMTRLPFALLAGALFLAPAALPLPAQQDSKMSGKDKMDKMDKMAAKENMSTAEKAAMFDKMSDKQKMAAMKMAGHDMSKMSSAERMSMMEKMSEEDKAAAVDKMHMGKSGDKMNGSGKMDKMKK